MSVTPTLAVKDLTKRYPGVVALDGIGMEILPGEVHALVGENGAGKSTFIKCVTGAIKPDEGEIQICGTTYTHLNPSEAIGLGVSAIYQEFNLVPYLTVAENIMLGRYPGKGGIVDHKTLRAQAAAIVEELGVPIDIDAKVSSLTVGFQQLVEIAKAVSREAKLIIMDEPSAALTSNEIEYLFKIVQRLRKKGVSILYISHRLEEIFEICDRVTVFRDGHYVTTVNINDTDTAELIRLMVNREIVNIYPHTPQTVGEVALEVENLRTPLLRDISFCVRTGEILGFSGLVGSGRTEIMRAIFGADPYESGTFRLFGKPYKPCSPEKAIANGIGYISEDRKKEGLLMSRSITENTIAASLKKVSDPVGIINDKFAREEADKICDRLGVKAPSYQQLVRNLSGGNQQKVVIAKWLFSDCSVIIFDEPTRGIDVGAKREIYVLMDELARDGKAIIMVSSDMPEMLGMADRIVIMHEGKLMKELSREEANQEVIMKYASGYAD